MRIRELAYRRPRFGANRIWVLLRREGWRINRKRVRRLYCLDGLQVRMRVKRRKHLALHRGPAPVPTGRGERWSMDFVHDQLMDGRAFRVRTVVDQWSREGPLLETAFSLTGKHVVGAFEDRIGEAKAAQIPHGRSRDGITSKAVDAWACYRGVELDFTRPGKPTDHGHIDSFNGRLRDACLNVHQFLSLDHAKRVIEA
jgi:putative transposase